MNVKVKSKMRPFMIALALLFMVGLVRPAQAATLSVVGSSLVGATDVDIGGTFYDVQFGTGSCADLFGGCDSVSDFDFQTEADATAAAQALLDQVFIDGPDGAFDTNPILTEGCESTSACEALVPYMFGFTPVAGTTAFSASAINFSPQFSDTTSFIQPGIGFSLADTFRVWAMFSPTIITPDPVPDPVPNPVPLPGAVWLFLTALGSMGLLGWRRKRTATA